MFCALQGRWVGWERTRRHRLDCQAVWAEGWSPPRAGGRDAGRKGCEGHCGKEINRLLGFPPFFLCPILNTGIWPDSVLGRQRHPGEHLSFLCRFLPLHHPPSLRQEAVRSELRGRLLLAPSDGSGRRGPIPLLQPRGQSGDRIGAGWKLKDTTPHSTILKMTIITFGGCCLPFFLYYDILKIFIKS